MRFASNEETTVRVRYGLPIMLCRKCNKEKDRSEFYTLRRAGRSESSATYCKQCANDATLVRQNANKLKGVEYLGGKCLKCGYNKSLHALSFHHRNPESKDKNYKRCKLWSWNRLKKELDKCDLLCHNCHAEIHEEMKRLQPLIHGI